MLTNLTLTARSTNRKLGNMAVTNRPYSTCPTSCPLLPARFGGPVKGPHCYADGPIEWTTRRHAADITPADAVAKLGKIRPGTRYLRDRVMGDVAMPDGSPDMTYLSEVAWVATAAGLIAYGYTHVDTFTAPQVAAVAASGYVLNVSTGTVAEVERAVSLGMPVTYTGDDVADGDVIAGRRVVTCPEQTGKVPDCSSCGGGRPLCARQDRQTVIRFLMH